RGPDPHRVDERGDQNRADGDRTHRYTEKEPEDAREELVWDESLKNRVDGDVEDGVSPAQHGEERHRGQRLRHGSDRGDRYPPQDEADADGSGKPPPDEVHGDQRANGTSAA